MNLPTYSPLLTDLYQLTMGYGYFRHQLHESEACFHVLFRSSPFKSNYAVCCGLATIVQFLNNWTFSSSDITYLATLKDPNGQALFDQAYLDYLAQLTFSCDVDAIPEGTVVFPNEPILRIQGPLLQCQLLETPILNIINYQTLIASKASRVCQAAQTDTVIEFGMRRAQGPDGALSASRAAYIGGCHATSNTLAGKLFDIPVRGTHAHSWVTAFPSEQHAFAAYIDVMPHNAVLLVDTYNTLKGVQHAIEAGYALREQGADLLGIRLDSGNLSDLSIKARALLDAAGFKQTEIVASNSLDEYVIERYKLEGSAITVWGVGTNLVTSYDQPALDGVYKMAALKNQEGVWEYKLKLSEQEIKISNPGRHQVRRFFFNDAYFIDVIYDIDIGMPDTAEAVLLNTQQTSMRLDAYDAFVDLLTPVFRQGKPVQTQASIHRLREQAISAVIEFVRQHNKETYPVGLESNLYAIKKQLIAQYQK